LETNLKDQDKNIDLNNTNQNIIVNNPSQVKQLIPIIDNDEFKNNVKLDDNLKDIDTNVTFPILSSKNNILDTAMTSEMNHTGFNCFNYPEINSIIQSAENEM